MDNIKEKIELLRTELHQHNYNYSVLNAPTISDKEFDDMMRQLQDCVRSGYDACYLNYMATLIICEISNQHRFFLSRGENGAEGIWRLRRARSCHLEALLR